ncbi:MAG: transposase [Eubacteriaceae bacterium]|jgi:REP element-mobilizing transposase RayT|nr:transposase [Eubacteriaceae bacterium]
MPRPSRDESILNIYHVLISGNNNESIFSDDEDKQQFISALEDKAKILDCSVYAFCVLSTKANMLLEPLSLSLSELMHQINISYAQYYNKKYSRSGHVFHDRYRSAAINSPKQFGFVKHYIYLNPVIEGITAIPGDYKYQSPLGGEYECTYESILGYYDNCFSNLDSIANSLIKTYLQKHNLSYESLNHRANFSLKHELVMLVRDSTGYSIRKISELLGINRGEVYRIIQIQQKEGLLDDM